MHDLTGTHPGIVTVSHWTMAPNGRRYLHFHSSHWQILTDEYIGEALGTRFRSSERWQLAAIDPGNSDQILGLFPGCQVKAWILGDIPSVPIETADGAACYSFDALMKIGSKLPGRIGLGREIPMTEKKKTQQPGGENG